MKVRRSSSWFTAATSFAKPAVAIAWSHSDTFSRIRPSGSLQLILAEIVGGLTGAFAFRWLLRTAPVSDSPTGMPAHRGFAK